MKKWAYRNLLKLLGVDYEEIDVPDNLVMSNMSDTIQRYRSTFEKIFILRTLNLRWEYKKLLTIYT